MQKMVFLWFKTAEGALTEVHSILNRMVELSTLASNGTYSDSNRENIKNEIQELKDEIDRIADSTNFNGINLLDGNLEWWLNENRYSTINWYRCIYIF